MNTFSKQHTTIAALATPAGIGGIAVIRVSGNDAFSLVDSLFHGKKKLADAESHTLHFGSILDANNNVVDSVLVSVFRSPHSYTGEDVLEISCHGGYLTSKIILDELYRIGAQPAGPGEFTLRAFLNGKLDLAQAEAVADLIHAKSEQSHRASVEQLHGRLSRYTKNLRQELLDICSLLELELDFSQEGIELTQKSEINLKLENIKERLLEILSTYSSGKHIREGVRVALVGKPNAGKSSLMNTLLEEERAIVSHIPGTTRDTIEESVTIHGLEFIFTDTAGLRESGDIIEQEGIKRTSNTVQSSDIVCVVIDSSEIVTDEDLHLYKRVQDLLPKHAQKIYIYNKADIKHLKFLNSVKKIEFPHIFLSCKTHEGIEEFKKLLYSIALPNFDTSASSVILNNLRHKHAFESALSGIDLAIKSLNDGLSDDFIAVDLRRAIDYLGEIIGITTPDDILNNIFSKFCIGK